MKKRYSSLKQFFSDFYLVAVLIFLYVPILTMMVLSFNTSKSRTQWGGFTLRWYQQMLSDPGISSALYNTLLIAFLSALIACIIGTAVLTVFGTAFNAIYLLPAFSKLYGMPLDSLLSMGSAVNPRVKPGSIVSFVVACVAPLNLIKGVSVSLVTLLVYKPLSPIIKTGHRA